MQKSEKIPEANENDQSSAASLSSEQVQVCKYSFTSLKKAYIYCQSLLICLFDYDYIRAVGVYLYINICVQTVPLKWKKPNTNIKINNYMISRSMQIPKRSGLYQANTSFSNVALLIRVVIKKVTETPG